MHGRNNLLGICFLHKCAPKFIFRFTLHVEQLSVHGREKIIHDNVNPFTKTPEIEMKDASVAFRVVIVPLLQVCSVCVGGWWGGYV